MSWEDAAATWIDLWSTVCADLSDVVDYWNLVDWDHLQMSDAPASGATLISDPSLGKAFAMVLDSAQTIEEAEDVWARGGSGAPESVASIIAEVESIARGSEVESIRVSTERIIEEVWEWMSDIARCCSKLTDVSVSISEHQSAASQQAIGGWIDTIAEVVDEASKNIKSTPPPEPPPASSGITVPETSSEPTEAPDEASGSNAGRIMGGLLLGAGAIWLVRRAMRS